MATYQKNFSSGWATLVLTVSESGTSAATNKGKISWSLKVKAIATGASWNTGGASITVTIGGTRRYTGDTFDIRGLAKGSSKTIASGSFTASHKADGTLSLAVAASFVSNVALGSASISDTFTGTTIPRATTPSVSPSTVAVGSKVTISTPRASSSFTHRLYYRIGSGSWVSIASNVGTSYSWTVPKSIANSFPSATSGSLTIRCITYNGSTQIGDAKTTTLKVTIPNTAEFKPSIGDIDVTEAVQAVTDAFSGLHAQGLSKLNVSIDAAGAYGSTIATGEYSATIDGVTYKGATFQTNVITGSGTLALKVTVNDSRGRSATKTVNVSIEAYTSPVINSLTYQQCDPDGTPNPTGSCTKVTIAGTVSSVSEQNSRTLTLKWKKSTDTAFQTQTLSTSSWTFTVSTLITGTATDETYEFIAVLADKMSETESAITTGVIAMSALAGGKGVTFGAEASEEGVVIAADWPFLIDDTELESLYNEVFGS